MERLACAAGAPADVLIAGARVVDPTSGLDGDALDVRIHQGVIAEVGPDLPRTELETIEADGLSARLRRPGRPPSDSRATRTRRTSARARARRRPAASPRSLRCRTPSRSSTPPSSSRAGASSRAARRACRPGSWPRSPPASRASAWPRCARWPTPARPPSRTTAAPSRPPRCSGRAFQYGRCYRAACWALHEDDLSLLGPRDYARGSGVRRGSAWPGTVDPPRVSGRLATWRSPATRAAPVHICHASAAESVAEDRARPRAGSRCHRRGDPAPPLPHRRARAQPQRRPLQDEPAAAIRHRPGRADRGARRRDDRLRRTTRAAPRPREGAGRSRRRSNGVIGLETAFSAIYTHLSSPASCRSRPSSSGCRPAPRPRSASRGRRCARVSRPASACGIWARAGSCNRRTRRDRRTAPSRGRPCAPAAT